MKLSSRVSGHRFVCTASQNPSTRIGEARSCPGARRRHLGNFLEAELIDHHVSPSYRPQGRGKIESLAGTVQRELWQVVHFSSLEEARERTRSFFQWYNYGRAHMGIDGLTLADRYLWQTPKTCRFWGG